MGGPILDVGAGEAETIAAGETRETGTVRNAGTVENAGTLQAGGLELATVSADIDAASGDFERLRTLASSSADVDAATGTLFNGRLLRGTATDIDSASGATERLRSLSGTGADVGAASGATERLRSLSGTGTDIDSASAGLERIRELLSSSADIDAASGGMTRTRDLGGEASDIDRADATLLILVSTDAQGAVEAIHDILSRSNDYYWSNTAPDVRNHWDDAQSERGPGADQPPVVYVWSPTGRSHERFSRDGDRSDDTATVEVQVWSLDERLAWETATDVTDILQFYFDDNKRVTQFQTIEPTATNDFREQKPARTTDHFVLSVEIDARVLEHVALE